MYETVKGMLKNFLYVVNKYGYVPNGGRIYYIGRSQPPLLIPMIETYFEYTNDIKFIVNNIETMEKEYNYWIDNHLTEVNFKNKTYLMAHYGNKNNDEELGNPRPESYLEDIETASVLADPGKRKAYYMELRATAESGWDFTSRFFIANNLEEGIISKQKI